MSGCSHNMCENNTDLESDQTPYKSELTLKSPYKMPPLCIDDSELLERLTLVKTRIYNEARENPEFMQELQLIESILTKELIHKLIIMKPKTLNQFYDKYEQAEDEQIIRFMAKYGKYLIEEIAHHIKMQKLIEQIINKDYQREEQEEQRQRANKHINIDDQEILDVIQEEGNEGSDINLEEDDIAKLLEDEDMQDQA